MASKNMTRVMALYLTFNLVLLGFTSAHAPPPPAQPQCPKDFVDVKVCLNVFTNLVNPQDPFNIITPKDRAQCCTVLVKLGGPIAALCSCQLARLRIPGVINLGLTTAQANQFLKLCPGVTAPPNFRCS